MATAEKATRNREAALAAALLVVLCAVAIRPSIRGVDGVGNYVYLMSILIDGDLDFSNDYAAFALKADPSLSEAIWPADPSTGLPSNRYGIGAAIFWAPSVALTHILLRAFSPETATGISRPYEWAVGLASACWGALGIWLLFVRMREQFSARAAWSASAGILAATSLGFYHLAHGSMSHAVSFFIAVVALLTLERAWREGSARSALALGVWSGLLVITRFQDISWAAALGLGLIAFWPRDGALGGEPPGGAEDGTVSAPRWRARPGRWGAAGLFAGGFLLALLPQMAVWKELYGSWFSGPVPYFGREAGAMSWAPRHLAGVLASERGGVFAWHPILLLGVGGLIAARGALGRGLWMTALAGLIAQIYLVSCWSMWWGGASFGNRFFISSYPAMALGLAGLLDRPRARGLRLIGPVAIALLIAWNLGLLIQYGTEMISREQEIGWAQVIKNQLGEVPRWIVRKFFG